tara:strand:+ start:70 stop:726 length:657 start_codon:yes stop_codon:yes gene_type:complete
MTNFSRLSSRKKSFISPENAVVLIPIISGLAISIIFLIAVFIPQYIQNKEKNDQIRFLEEKVNFIPIYKKQLNILNQRKEEGLKQRGRLLNLIAGKKEVDTILNQINSIALNNQIIISELKPFIKNKSINKYATKEKFIKDPLLQPSIEKFMFKLSLKGEFNDLIQFLREIELLETFIISKNININSIKENSVSKKNNQIIKMMIDLSVYGQSNSKLK